MQRRSPRDTRLRALRDALPMPWRQVADLYLHIARKLFDEQPVGIDLIWTRIDERNHEQGMSDLGKTLGVRSGGYACVHLARYEVAEVTLPAPTRDGAWAVMLTVSSPADGAIASRLEHGFARTVRLKFVQGACSVLVARPYSFGCDLDVIDGETAPKGGADGARVDARPKSV